MPVIVGTPRDDIRIACCASTTSKPKTPYKRMGQQFIAGGSAGLVEICLMHPLDVIKTRFQLQGSAASTTQYRSIAHCFTTMYRTEGFMSFYKGILPPIFAEMPKRAVKFFCFERYQDMLAGDNPKTPLIYAIAGMGTGLTEAVVINPFWTCQSTTTVRNQRQIKRARINVLESASDYQERWFRFQRIEQRIDSDVGKTWCVELRLLRTLSHGQIATT